MITSDQKKQLTAAGYTIKGDTVLNKSGKTVGGYNKNGNIFSGSSTVRDILKSKPEKKVDTPAKKTSGSAKKADMVKPRQRQKGRGDGAAETARRFMDARLPSVRVDVEKSEKGNNQGPKEPIRRAEDKAARAKVKTSRRPTGSNVPFVGTSPTRDEWNNMSVMERLRWGSILPPSVQKEDTGVKNTGNTRGRKALRDSRGYAKGGMVKANCGASMKPTQRKK
jgi:hypothetical protein